MDQEWGPTLLGRLLTRSPPWRLRLDGEGVELALDGQLRTVPIEGPSSVGVRRGLLWATLVLAPGQPGEKRVGGLANGSARALDAAFRNLLAEQELRRRVAVVAETRRLMDGWLGRLSRQLWEAYARRLWITHEQQQASLAARPALPVDEAGLRRLLAGPGVLARTGETAEQFERRLAAWATDWPATWAEANEANLGREVAACRGLFDRVEGRPLTEEQARAAACFDNRVQVVAAAGSGKTSTMVAKAAYAIHRGLAQPGTIVMLAYNRNAAAELRERAAASFRRLSWDGTEVQASTFHALGLSICGQATGRKPDVPDWTFDPAEGARKMASIVGAFKEASPGFRRDWDLFRVVFGRVIPDVAGGQAEDAAGQEGPRRQRTIRGELVRSGQERMIADWLFHHGVDYEYERAYEFDTATERHRQYRPDFYYPAAGLYHEHLALDAEGNAPPQFEGYLEGVAWKRAEHGQRGTQLLETTSHGLWTGQAFADLAEALTRRGVVLDPDPSRRPPGSEKPLTDASLTSLIRAFIGHAKSSCMTSEAMTERLARMPEGMSRLRHATFLVLALSVLKAWDKALAEEGGVDFEDMLNQAAEHLEQGRWTSPYALVMADEFQDASRSRARLCDALVRQPGRHLFVVGDDWQAINRFAGADVSVMTRFRERAGHGQVLRLERTFRCPQALCDAAGRFVSRNPNQLAKVVRSDTPAHGPVLRAFGVRSRERLADAVDGYLAQLHQAIMDGTAPHGRGGPATVFVLGRYNAEAACVPPGWERAYGDRLRVQFLTVHRSKGAEADYVIIPGMGSKGFPNLRGDDPVLSLAMPDGDDYPLGEERRLFYVALTRARRSVAMFSVGSGNSPFLDELIKDGAVSVEPAPGPPGDQGAVAQRDGRAAASGDASARGRDRSRPVGGTWPAVVRRYGPQP